MEKYSKNRNETVQVLSLCAVELNGVKNKELKFTVKKRIRN
jgi:hypothetical protein